MIWLRSFWQCLIAALALFTATAHAAGTGSLISSQSVALPDLPVPSDQLVLAGISGRPIAITPGQTFVLEPVKMSWRPTASELPFDPASATAVVTDGQATLLFAPYGKADAPVRLSLNGTLLQSQALPSLPLPLTQLVGAIDDGKVWVAGLDQANKPRLLSMPLTEPGQWTAHDTWPSGQPALAIGAQNKGLFVTFADHTHWRWLPASGWKKGADAPGTIARGSVRSIGQAHLLYSIYNATGQSQLYSYSAITDAWASVGAPLSSAAVAAAPYGDGLLVAERNGTGFAMMAQSLKVERQTLAILDWAIIALYMFAMLSVGFYFYRSSKGGSSNEFFLGSRSIPFWAAGISMFAGSISSISYLAIPAKAFETNWQYIMSKITTIFGLIFVAIWIVPLFRKLNLVSVFDYLETRFHPSIRLLSSAMWMLMQIGGRMGIVLYLPAMAIGTITDINIVACILIVGIFTIIYTALGGMKAVVWTDVFQVIVLTGGAVFAIGYVIHQLGWSSIVQTARAFDKTTMVNVSFDITQPTIWGFLILVLFDVVLTFPKDQVLMQKVLATPSEKEAGRSVWIFALVLLPSAFMFYIIGTVLFAYYRANPGQLNPLLPIDAVFPSFIGTELPTGITGLIIAGLMAAAMGTLSGIINSVATLLSVDFYARFKKVAPTQKQTVRFAEWMSVIVGTVGIAIALVLSRMDIHSLLDLTIELFGLLGGSCAGAYSLGMFTKRANWQGVIIGIIAASVLTLVVWYYGLLHPYWYLALAIMGSIVIGYIASLFFPRPAHSLEGLTVYSRRTKTA